MTSKGSGPVSTKYACGGAVLQPSRSRFLKTPDVFRGASERQDYGGKKDPLAKAKGETKCLTPVKPRT